MSVRTVEPEAWVAAVAGAREEGWRIFDWLAAVDEVGRSNTIRVVCHLQRDDLEAVRLQTEVDRDRPVLASIAGVFGGAGWHEREAREFFGIQFASGDNRNLLLPESYTGHPLRKDEVLGARSTHDWPGAKGEGSASAGRRRMVPPGVPDPDVWGERSGEPATPDEIAASVAGGRVRRRR